MRYLLLIFLFFASLGTAHARFEVVATTPMMHSFASQVYGNPMNIKTLSCAPTGCRNALGTGDAARLQHAQLIVWLGTEQAVAQWLKAHPEAQSFSVLTQTAELEVVPSKIDPQQQDPYVWTSPANALAILKSLTKKLSELDPKNAARYAKNLEQYTDRWQFFDSYKLPTIDTKYPPLVSLQEGMEYLFNYLGLSDVKTFPVDETRANYMQPDTTLAGRIKQLNPVCVFVGPNISKHKLMQLNLPKSIKIVSVNLEGNPKKQGPYLYRIVMRKLFADVYECLGLTLPRRKR